jgi:hypothetical protein
MAPFFVVRLRVATGAPLETFLPSRMNLCCVVACVLPAIGDCAATSAASP